MMAAFRLLALILPIQFVLAPSAGAQLTPRCAACHLPTGAGVPGSFPSLRGITATLATKAEGRRYLVLAITRGLAGPIQSGGQAFRGVMPAQPAMSNAAIAETLNALIRTAGPAAQPFTETEVHRLRLTGAKLSAAEVARLRVMIR
jgi:mono/diheme cytochrome c family protein